jgi:hypothetical protein
MPHFIILIYIYELQNFFSAEMMDKMVKDIFMRAHQLTGLVRDDINTWEASGVSSI